MWPWAHLTFETNECLDTILCQCNKSQSKTDLSSYETHARFNFKSPMCDKKKITHRCI